jgi:diguanylate cyclase (GGDEF)-like protein
VTKLAIPSNSGTPLGYIFVAREGQTPTVREIAAAMSSSAGLASLAIETSQLHSDLVHRSEFDLLTDIRNRFSFEKRLDELIEDAREQSYAFGLIYIDLDYFKRVNDCDGHQAGDQYLQAVAARMKGQLRSCDTLARLGGDEFAALVRDVSCRAGVEEVAQRMEHCFDDPFKMTGCTIKGSASIGVAFYSEDGVTRDKLLNHADAAMYVAKQMRIHHNSEAAEMTETDRA